MSKDLFSKIRSFIDEQKEQGPDGPAADTLPDLPPVEEPGLGGLVGGSTTPTTPAATPKKDAGLAALVKGSDTSPPKGDAAVPDIEDLPPIPEQNQPKGKKDRLPANATLDDLIAFAKSRSKKEASAPGATSPSGAIPTALPLVDDDLPQPEMALPSPALGSKQKAQAGVMPALPDIDLDIDSSLAPMLDVDRILAEKRMKDQQSVRKLFTMEYLPPAPRSVAETGLEPAFLGELIIKTVYYASEMEGLRIAEELALPFAGVVEPLVRQLKDENYLEIKGGGSSMAAQWRFSITSKGVEKAHEVLQRNGYYGPAPVPVHAYTDMVHRQRISPDVSLKEVKAAFSDLVLNEATLEKVGPAINSAKSAFLYGPPGNGKTSICERMCTLLGGAIFIPYALEIGGQVIKLYDPYVHQPPEGIEKINLTEGELARIDRRWVICRRPIVIVGGELTLEMLDLTYNEDARFYEAPFQVKSNGGMLLIDDFGRQKVRPRDLLNRWIVPLEKNVDYLTLHTGKKCEIPFDQFIVFSTNLNPADLVDEAFLRRLRYKIEIEDPSVEEFIEIFKRTCKGKGVKYQSTMMKYLLENFYLKEGVAFRACHPRDLIDQIIDRARYRKITPQLTPELIELAWKSYFVEL